MRRLTALISVSLAPGLLLASCGGTASSVRSAPPTSVLLGTRARLHLRAGSESADRAGLPAIYPVRPTKYVLDQPLADLGASAVVRRLVPHGVTESDVRELAAALGLTDGVVVNGKDGFTVSGPDATLTVSITGGTTSVNYGLGGPGAVGGSSGASSGSGVATGSVGAPDAPAGPDAPTVSTPPPATTPAPVDVPDASDTATIARALLDRMGVLGSEQWTVDVADSGGVAISCPEGVPCPTVPPVVYERTATFQRVVDGVDVAGSGWSVTVGAHGRVQSVSGTWAAAEPVNSYSLR